MVDELALARAALVEQEERLRRLVSCADALAANRDLEDVARALCAQIDQAVHADCCAVYVAGRDGADGDYRLRAATGSGASDVPAAVAAPAARRAEGERLELPFGRSGAIVGVVHLERARPYSEAEIDELEHLVKLGTIAIAHSLAVQDAERQANIARAMREANPDAIGLFDASGRPIIENGPMRRVRPELESSGWRAPFADRRANDVRSEIEFAGDRERTYSRVAVPVEDDDGFLGTLVVLRDTTAERAAERAKDRFFALVSHELRTPLTAIIGFLELAFADDGADLAPEQAQAIEVIERNTRRLYRLVSDLLFVAQVEARVAELPRARVALGRIVAETLESARPQAHAARVALEPRIERDVEVLGDADRLGQLIENLVSNALKFTPAGGEVTVRLTGSDGHARLEVIDTGTGIEVDDEARLFEAFYRSPTAVARHVPGVGLGLAVAGSIVRAHAGEIKVRSAPGEGTTFVVELPAL
ncbi:MAG TPA: ATP-binding protein [Solirubrobacteraceae bacterium]